MANKSSTSPWVWIGCGCFALVALVVGGLATLGFFGAKAVRDFEAEIKDPVKRAERARTILGAEQLPEGFNAQFHLRIPFLLEMVSLSDGEPLDYDEERHQARLRSENLGERAFIYLSMRDVGDARQDFERMFEGAGDLENVDLDFRSHAVLGHGEFELPPQKLRYRAHRGEFRDGRDRRDGIYAILLVDCPGSAKVRGAFYWQTQEIEGLVEGEDVDLTGSDYEEGLRRFMGHFHLCDD